MSFFSFISKKYKGEIIMLSILVLLLECLRELFLVVVVGGFVAIASAGIVVYILSKLLGVDRLRELAELEERLDLLLAEEHMHEVEDDYIVTEDGERILYDEDTQE